MVKKVMLCCINIQTMTVLRNYSLHVNNKKVKDVFGLFSYCTCTVVGTSTNRHNGLLIASNT